MRRHNVQRNRRSGAAMNSAMPWRFFILIIICAAVLASGFFFAARQHFSTMDLGLKNSKMRKQIEELESERRRLILSKEVSLSPSEIARTAHAMGFKEHTDQPQATIVRDTKPKAEPDSVQPVLTSFREQDKPVQPAVVAKKDKKLVETIVQQTASKAAPAKPSAKPTAVNERPRVVSKSDKQVSQTTSQKSPKLR
jgi:hypothetical protein